jgi:hypothetical protein
MDLSRGRMELLLKSEYFLIGRAKYLLTNYILSNIMLSNKGVERYGYYQL